MRIRAIWPVIAGLVGFGLFPSSARASGAEGGQSLYATVVGVRGMVEVRAGEDDAWQIAQVGMVLPVGAECRTGLRSAITLTMPPQQTITLDRLGTVKILEAFRGEKLTTELGMSYGRLRYRIEAAGIEHESRIRTPSNVLAIRGTDVVASDDALGYGVSFFSGSGRTQNEKGEFVDIAPTDGEPSVLTDSDLWPSDYFKRMAFNPYYGAGAMTGTEQDALNRNSSVGGLQTGLWRFREGSWDTSTLPRPPVPPTDVVTAMGRLSFSLSWTGDGASGPITPNLDLFVISPLGEILIPRDDAPFSVASGGAMSRNDRGGRNSTLGVEVATWDPSYPVGKYTYGVRYVDSGDPATYKILVLVDGKQINADFDDTVTELDPQVVFTIDVKAPASVSPSLARAKARTPMAAKTTKPAVAARATPPAARLFTGSVASPAASGSEMFRRLAAR